MRRGTRCSRSAVRGAAADRVAGGDARADVTTLVAVVLALLAAIALARPAAAGEVDEVRAAWQGAWLLLSSEVASNCDGRYTNNDVHGALVEDRGLRRFAAGELGRVAKVQLKKKRVDLLVDLVEPVLLAVHDGPFILYRESPCHVELRVDLPRSGARERAAEANRRLAELADRYPSLAAAEASPRWNGRRREPYPEDYEETLAEYEAWRAAELNADVAARIDDALEEAGRIAARVETDREYAVGFVEGLEVMTEAYWGGCPDLLEGTFYGKKESPPRGSSEDWEDGYLDGQRLGYHLEVARRLQHCFVPVPEE